MILEVTFSDFIREFRSYGREDQFSFKGLEALFTYLTDLEEELGQPYKLDVIELCCNYTEYESLDEFRSDYGYDEDEIEDIEDIGYYTTVIDIDGERFIIQRY